MSTPERTLRWVWLWCLLYTAPLPGPVRRGRREEMRSHLWEATRAGHSSAAVLGATCRGALADLAWTAGAAARAGGRLLMRPDPYVVLAALSPVTALVVSSMAAPAAAEASERAGAVGGALGLALALVAWVSGRCRS